MPATIHASSAAVMRTLQSLATAAPDDLSIQHESGQIRLLRDGALLRSLACPAHPQHVARALAALSQPILPALGNGWQFDTTTRQLTRENQAHALTEKEALLLRALLTLYPQPCARETLLKEVWGIGTDVETHTLETHIYRLRNKLETLAPRPCDIITAGSAYQLVMEPA